VIATAFFLGLAIGSVIGWLTWAWIRGQEGFR
jgi:hypothetical protein